MSILIKGMEMPRSCFVCPFRRKVDPDNIMCIVTREVFEETFAGTIETRNRGNCPLVPVPPHGRLIDADALEQDAQERLLICNKYDNQFQKPYEVMSAIALAPTIIPDDYFTEEAGK